MENLYLFKKKNFQVLSRDMVKESLLEPKIFLLNPQLIIKQV